MRGVLVILSIVGLMCLVGGVVANDLANSTITSTQAWVIANGTDHSTITVTAVDSNGKYQAGIPVSFSLAANSVAYGNTQCIKQFYRV